MKNEQEINELMRSMIPRNFYDSDLMTVCAREGFKIGYSQAWQAAKLSQAKEIEEIKKENEELKEEIKKLQHQLEIQTKRVENFKKSNEFYADPESWIKRNGDAWNKSSPREKLDEEIIRHYRHPEKDWVGTVVVGGKLARECQAKDQELEKELENLK